MSTLPETMQAIRLRQTGKADKVMRYETVPLPAIGRTDVLIRVHAIGVTFSDILVRTGDVVLGKDFPHIPGSDCAGVIVAVGADVSGWAVGERVVSFATQTGLHRDGSYADYVAVPTTQLHKLPDAMSYQTAVCFGTPFIRTWVGLLRDARIRKREQVVIRAGGTVVAAAAIQLARQKEANVVVIDTLEKHEALRALGASMVLSDDLQDLVAATQLATNDEGASLVVDGLGKDTLNESIAMLAHGGRVLAAGIATGDLAIVDIWQLMQKQASIIGATDALQEGEYENILSQVVDGTWQPAPAPVLPLSEAVKAHQLVESAAGFGLVVLVPDSLTVTEEPTPEPIAEKPRSTTRSKIKIDIMGDDK